MNTTPILRATNIVKKLGGKTILNDVSLDVHKGDVKVVIGPSGAGKSTFLQCLNYLLPPDSGDIWLEGKKVNARDTRELCALRQQVGMIFQDFNLFDHLTAEENVSIALRKVMGCNKAEARNRALTELSRVGLAKRAALYPAQLSRVCFPAASNSASPLPAPLPWTPRSCSSTSLPPPSTPSLSAKCSRLSVTSRTAA